MKRESEQTPEQNLPHAGNRVRVPVKRLQDDRDHLTTQRFQEASLTFGWVPLKCVIPRTSISRDYVDIPYYSLVTETADLARFSLQKKLMRSWESRIN